MRTGLSLRHTRHEATFVGSMLIVLSVLCWGCATRHAGMVMDMTAVCDWESHLHAVATVTHPPLDELSGIERSETSPDLWWVHNDSGDEPCLFGINSQGKVVIPDWQTERYYADEPEEGKEPWRGVRLLNAANQDWEDLTLHDGRLYIADTGNNGNAKRDLGIYIVNEPNPAAMDQGARPITFITIAYPDQTAYPPKPPDDWRFDCEAVFFNQGKLYFLTKYRADQHFDRITTGTTLYRLDTMKPDQVNTLTLVHRADDMPITPTAADLSPDGQRLAVLSHEGVWLFDKPRRGDDWLASPAIRIALSERIEQAEGICWDDADTLRIVNEQRGVLTLDLRPLKPVP